MFKIADKVKLINENYCGVVKEVFLTELLIVNDFGFEEKLKFKEVFNLKEKLDYSLLDEEINSKTNNNLIEKKSVKKIEIIEVDLHIGNLTDNLKQLSNYEMLKIQTKTINETLDNAIENNIKTVIFIHGKGKGVLKKELYKILEERKILNFFDASYNKYKMGATEIRLK